MYARKKFSNVFLLLPLTDVQYPRRHGRTNKLHAGIEFIFCIGISSSLTHCLNLLPQAIRFFLECIVIDDLYARSVDFSNSLDEFSVVLKRKVSFRKKQNIRSR